MNYEFAALNNDDLEEGIPSSTQAGGAVGGRRKARDLYDAFGASEDEDELFSDDESEDSQDEKGDYFNEAAHGIDEGGDSGDRQKLLGREDR